MKKTEQHQRGYVKTFNNSERTHIETYLITTYWFLFIPVYKTKVVINSTI